MTASNSPWASGPGEILRHGLHLLRKDNDVNRRLAMISIDNSVELMIKTYLGLPKRVTGINMTRKEFQDISESFPAMLDALEQHCAPKLTGIDLGEIEWYHRLRNQLYHQGNGLTVERDKVTVYAELAKLLFANLFGQSLGETTDSSAELVGQFLLEWRNLEFSLMALNSAHGLMNQRPLGVMNSIRWLSERNILPSPSVDELRELSHIRNTVVHAQPGSKDALTPDVIARVCRQTQIVTHLIEAGSITTKT